MKPLKSPTHIHLFDENFYGFETVFCIMVFGIFSMFYVRIMQSENSATNIHTHYRQSETAPPIYARIICEKNPAQIYMKNRGAAGMMCARLIGVGIFAFVCITFCICGHRLDKVVFVDWSMSKFDCKSVMGLHKFIVKM